PARPCWPVWRRAGVDEVICRFALKVLPITPSLSILTVIDNLGSCLASPMTYDLPAAGRLNDQMTLPLMKKGAFLRRPLVFILLPIER
ncbi:MAG TPA: hypothetical protein PKD91_11545, partial [Bacteroidia bacterium]|nr:hypothetical protein [Bacteroidia bacterium]